MQCYVELVREHSIDYVNEIIVGNYCRIIK